MNPQCSAYFSFYPDAITPHQYYAVNFSTGVQPLTYQWNWGDGSPLTTQAYPTHTYTLPGNYIICLTIADALGCTQTYCNPPTYLFKSENSIVQVNVIAPGSIGIADNEKKGMFSIYPNPASDYVTIQLAEDVNNATIKVYNLLGELKSITNASQAKTDIDISKLAAGVYIIEVVTDKSSYRQKFIKE